MKKTVLIFVLTLFTSISIFGQKSVAVFWDASYSMLDRDIAKETQLLDTVINNSKIDAIKLVVFANKVLNEETIADFSTLKKKISSLNYDGSTVSPNLSDYSNYDYILCFSDYFDKEKNYKNLKDKLFFISSNLSNEKASFNHNGANYLNLNLDSIENVLASFNNEKELADIDKDLLGSNNIIISGELTDEFGILKGYKVMSLKSNRVVSCNNLGYYKIESFDGDVLQFISNNKLLKTIKIYSKSDKVINLDVSNKVNQLDQVVIETDKKSNLKVLGKSMEETRKLGYAVAQVNASDFTPAEKNISEMVGKNVPGIRGQAKDNLGSVVIRGFSSIWQNNHPLVFIDDVPIENSTKEKKANYKFIDPNIVESVKVLKGLAATSIYGPHATNGVILIYTKKGKFSEGGKKGRGNIYDKKLKVETTNADYEILAKILSKGQSVDESYSLYLKERLKMNNTDNLDFYFNSADFFDKQGDYNKAIRILSNVEEIYPLNEKELLALAYKYEQKHFNKEALRVYKKLNNFYPNSIQIQRDLANSYFKNQDYNLSYNTYSKLLNSDLVMPSDYKKLVLNEIKRVVNLHGEKITSQIPDLYKKTVSADGRLVFEWNDTSANFNLQFINPDKLFYDWKHNNQDASERMQEEQEKNYSSQEFMLLNAEKGDWFFNVLKPNNYSETQNENSFVKMTLYKNYGKSNEIKTVKLINLKFNSDSKTIARIRI